MIIEKKTFALRRYAVLTIFAVLFLVPYYIVLRNSFATDRIIIARTWVLWPRSSHFIENLKNMFENSELSIISGLYNSAVTSVSQTFLHILFAAMSGYALAKIPFKYSNIVFAFVRINS